MSENKDQPQPLPLTSCREAELLELIRDFVDPDDCWFDHHGYCQAHGRAKRLLDETKEARDET